MRDASRVIGKSRFTSNRTLDSIRLDVMQPPKLADMTGLALAKIEARSDGVRIGAMARNVDVAQHPAIAVRYPALTEALRSGGTPHLEFAGERRNHGLVGIGEHWIASYPADTLLALVALDAIVHTRGSQGPRAVAISEFTTGPATGEVVTHIQLPVTRLSSSSRYVKVRDPWRGDPARASSARPGDADVEARERRAVSSAVVALEIDGWRIRDARVALGAVATRPWRAWEVERALIGHPPTLATYRRAAAHATYGPRSRSDTELMIVRALVRTASSQP